jgi:hypothetical protein
MTESSCPRLVSRPVPEPRKRPGNEACESRRLKPKASPNHTGRPGEGKTGRVNVSEPLTRLQDTLGHPTVVHGMMKGQGTMSLYLTWSTVGRFCDAVPQDTRPSSKGGTRPRRVSTGAERGDPVAVWLR